MIGLAPAALLSRDELASVLTALDTAADYLECRASLTCEECAVHPAECCDEHAADLENATACRALARALGDDQ